MKKKYTCLFLAVLAALSLAGCRQNEESVDSIVIKDKAVYTFSDGKSVSTGSVPLLDGRLLYLLDDGTQLLAETTPYNEDGRYSIIGSASAALSNISSIARDKITAFYEAQEPQYCIEDYLVKAYEEYTADPSAFSCYWVEQSTFQSASGETVLYLTTTITLPLGGRNAEEYFITQAFDKNSGEAIDSTELFSMDMDSIRDLFLTQSQYTSDEATLNILREDFCPEYIRFTENVYEICFRHKTCERLGLESSGLVLCGSFTNKILSAFQPWAVPVFAE